MKKIMNTDLSIKNLGEEVTLYAWINKVRDQGFITFIDLRDRSGIIQVSIKENNPCLDIVKTLKKEYVVKVKGIVKERESKNPKLKTGDIEIDLEEIEILKKSLTLPFELNEELSNEDTRLKYRYLDLRREELQKNLITRHKLELIIRNYLEHRFTNITLNIFNGSEDNEDNNETRLYLTESELQEFALDLLNLVREVIFSLKNAIQISENEKQSTLSSEVALIPINYEEVDSEDKL